jgi:hypothetical protein
MRHLALLALMLTKMPVNFVNTPKVCVIVWMDTEDYLLPADDDATLRLARFLSEEGVRASFKLVGEKARVLERRGRTDVIEALKKHEIGYHTDFHSVHPTPAQYLSTLGWDEGVAEFERREGPGIEDLRRIFGQNPACYGQPGSSWGPQAFGALRNWGVPVYLDIGSHLGVDRKPHYYAGALTIYDLAHTVRTGLGGPADLEKAKANFAKAREKLLADGGGIAHLFYHPCEWVHQQFWDGVNFAKGANPPRSEWKPPGQKPAEETRVAFETFEAYVRWLKTFADVRFVSAGDALKIYRDRARGREFKVDELREIAKGVGEDVSFQRRGELALSASEIFQLLNSLVVERGRGPIRLADTPLGPATAVPRLEKPAATTWSQFERTAADVDAFIRRHGRLPPTVWLGSAGVPPESYLRALAFVALELLDGRVPATIEVPPARLGCAKYVADDSPRIFGWLFPEGFHAPAMMELAKRQSWTIKPAILDPAALP